MTISKSIFNIEFMRGNQKPALLIDGQLTCYDELYNQASNLAYWMEKEKIESLAVTISRQLSDYIALIACLLSSKTFVPINPKWTPSRQKQVQELTKACLIPPTLPNIASDYRPKRIDAKKNAYIIFTSGSTGTPKGVPITYANLAAYLTACKPHLHLKHSDKVAQYADLTFDMGLHDAYTALLFGACLCVVPNDHRLAPFRYIKDNQISVWFSLPSIVSLGVALKQLGNNSLPSLRLTLFSGEALYRYQAKKWFDAAPNTRILNSYGPSEHTVGCCYFECDQQTLDSQPEIVCIGKPFGKTMVALHGESWDAEQGELWLAGPQLTPGYLDEAYPERFQCHQHPLHNEQRFYRTGDWCHKDSDGNYHYMCRIDNQVKVNGQFISLETIEAHLSSLLHSEVAALIHKPKSSLQPILCIFLTIAEYKESTIREAILQILQENVIPIRFILLKQLPRNPNDKIDKQALRNELSL